jgi:hypothetical protein
MVIVEVLVPLRQNLLIPTGGVVDLPRQVFDNIGRSIAGRGRWAQYKDVWGRTLLIVFCDRILSHVELDQCRALRIADGGGDEGNTGMCQELGVPQHLHNP